MKAVLFVHTPDGETLGEPVEGPDCVGRARKLRNSIEDDFPDGTIFMVGSDNEGATDHLNRIMQSLREDTIEIDVEDGNV